MGTLLNTPIVISEHRTDDQVAAAQARAEALCNLGVGCMPPATCFAKANGCPERCGAVDTDTPLPWTTSHTETRSTVFDSDFSTDAALRVTGDFETPDARREYAEKVCAALNLASRVPMTYERVQLALATMEQTPEALTQLPKDQLMAFVRSLETVMRGLPAVKTLESGS